MERPKSVGWLMAGTRGIIFARGRNALAICRRCGINVPNSDQRRDGQNKNIVCSDCWDPKHPQEYMPRDIYDATALRNPSPDPDINKDSYTLERGALCATAFLGKFTVS